MRMPAKYRPRPGYPSPDRGIRAPTGVSEPRPARGLLFVMWPAPLGVAIYLTCTHADPYALLICWFSVGILSAGVLCARAVAACN